jgi:hypothetical protein
MNGGKLRGGRQAGGSNNNNSVVGTYYLGITNDARRVATPMLRNLAENFECLLVLPWCLALFDLPEKVVKPGLECGGESIKL